MVMLIRFAKNICISGQVPNSMHVRRACGFGQDVLAKEGANMRAVWDLPTARYPGEPFRRLLAEVAGTHHPRKAAVRLGGIVLDLFVGVGSACRIANSLGCGAIGIDLSQDYLAMAERRTVRRRPDLRADQSAFRQGEISMKCPWCGRQTCDCLLEIPTSCCGPSERKSP